MQQRILVILLALFVSEGCAQKGPLITTCITDPARGEFECFNEKTQAPSIVKWGEDTDNWICRSPDDEKTLMSFCGSR